MEPRAQVVGVIERDLCGVLWLGRVEGAARGAVELHRVWRNGGPHGAKNSYKIALRGVLVQ